jgi:hypothetical protein
MSFNRILPVGALIAGSLLLSGCGALDGLIPGLGNSSKQGPDEFQVVAQQPLSIPPNADLRPPRPGAPRPQDTPPQVRAQSLVSGQPVSAVQAAAGGSASPSESALLAKAGANTADPNIRSTVNQETGLLAEQDRSLIDDLIFWRKAERPGRVIDPAREQQRIRETQATGQPVTTGTTPTIERRKRGLLEGIF